MDGLVVVDGVVVVVVIYCGNLLLGCGGREGGKGGGNQEIGWLDIYLFVSQLLLLHSNQPLRMSTPFKTVHGGSGVMRQRFEFSTTAVLCGVLYWRDRMGRLDPWLCGSQLWLAVCCLLLLFSALSPLQPNMCSKETE